MSDYIFALGCNQYFLKKKAWGLINVIKKNIAIYHVYSFIFIKSICYKL